MQTNEKPEWAYAIERGDVAFFQRKTGFDPNTARWELSSFKNAVNEDMKSSLTRAPNDPGFLGVLKMAYHGFRYGEWSPLALATELGNEVIIEQLLARGADPMVEYICGISWTFNEENMTKTLAQ